MSLWTPGGEHPIDPNSQNPTGQNPVPGQAPAQGSPTQGAEPPLTPEQEEQAQAVAEQMSEAKARVLEADAADVLANHAIGIYELAVIHLTADSPKLEQVQLAIDGLAAIVSGLQGRLGEGEPTLKEMLSQIQMAFVQIKEETESSTT